MAYLHGEEMAHGDLRKVCIAEADVCAVFDAILFQVNVLVDDDDMAVISDFGLAAYLHGRSERYASTRSGNPMWLAPELLDERTGRRNNNVRQTSQSDVYSFASLCVEASPFNLASKSNLSSHPIAVRKHPHSISCGEEPLR